MMTKINLSEFNFLAYLYIFVIGQLKILFVTPSTTYLLHISRDKTCVYKHEQECYRVCKHE